MAIGMKQEFVIYNKFKKSISIRPAYIRLRKKDKYFGPYWKILGKTTNNIQFPMIDR